MSVELFAKGDDPKSLMSLLSSMMGPPVGADPDDDDADPPDPCDPGGGFDIGPFRDILLDIYSVASRSRSGGEGDPMERIQALAARGLGLPGPSVSV